MKLLLALSIFFSLSGCASISETCNHKKSASVFESKTLEINEIVELNGVKNVVFKSYSEPNVTESLSENKLFINGTETVSVMGYHTDQCTAKETIKNIQNTKPSVGYHIEIENSTLIIRTTGEKQYIHHRNVFSGIKVRIPKNINFTYEHLPLTGG